MQPALRVLVLVALAALILLGASAARAQESETATPTPTPSTPAGPGSAAGSKDAGYCGFGAAGACSSLASTLVRKTSFARGEQALVMLLVGYNGTQTCVNQTVVDANNTATVETVCTNFTRAAEFFPLVDQLVVLEIPRSGSLVRDGVEATLAIGTTNALLPLVPGRNWFRDPYYVGSRSVYITLDNGRVSGLTWDEGRGCADCPEEQCIDNTCGIKPTSPSACGETCNIKIYLTWAGVDSRGRQMTSGGYANSQIQAWWPFAQSVFSYYASVLFAGLGGGGFSELTTSL